jgi:hypothetical protein
MSLGEIIEANKAMILGVVIVILLSGGIMVGISSYSSGYADGYTRWYYDLETGEQVQFTTLEGPPVALKNGHQAVIAHIYGCGGCSGDTFVGHLERFDPTLDKTKRFEGTTTGTGVQFALAPEAKGGEIQWFDRDSRDGFRVKETYREKCQAGNYARECIPGVK